MKKICLSCKDYRPLGQRSGCCRVDRKTLSAEHYPVMQHGGSCERWQDAGQQYYIRIGWLNKLKEHEQH
jgi:hypothetical protein